jgi:methyl-accepting chemotaxis protein
VSAACTEQASAVQQTVATLDELSATGSKSVEGAKTSMQMSKNSHLVAAEGKKSVEEMVQAIDEIDSSNKQLAVQIEESNKRFEEVITVIHEIGSKTKIINDIVFQTKLLSFNASVEAARAGEHGKGFAVVAEEVGNLAQMSGLAAKEISDMLNSSIEKVKMIVRDSHAQVERIVESGKGKVETGNTVAKNCGEIIDRVVSNIVQVDVRISEICRIAEEQANGIKGISQAMNQMDQAILQNANSAEQTAKISDDLMEQAKSLQELVHSFEKQALGSD